MTLKKNNNIMNIGCFTHEYPPVGGGGSTTINEINLRLSQMGVNINVLTTAFKDTPKIEKKGKIHIKRLQCFRKEQATSSLNSLAFYALSSLYHAPRYYNENDIIHAYFVIPAGIPGYFMKKVKKKPLIVTIFGADIYDPTRFKSQREFINYFATKRILKSADIVTTISHDLVSRIKEVYDRDVEIIHCGVDINKFYPENIIKVKRDIGFDYDKINLVSVGRLVKRKRFDILLYAIEKVKKINSDILLTIIGQGPEKEQLIEIINKLGLQQNVSLVGFVEEELLLKYYQACDIFVLSSAHEGQGCSILEAMSCGKPIVATNIGGIPDSVINKYNGILVPVDNSEELAKALLLLIENEDLRLEMGINSRKRCINNFDWDIIANQTNKIYSELV